MRTLLATLSQTVRLLFAAVLLLASLNIPTQAQVDDIDDEACLDCHDELEATLRHTPHQLAASSQKPAIEVRCVSCHSGAEVHVEDPEIDNIGNPAALPAAETEKTCTACHQPHMEAGTAGYDPHLGQDISCTSCHQIHQANNSLLIDGEGGFCQVCHISVVGEFRKRSNHPLTDQALTCMSCHDFTSGNDVNFGHGTNVNCYRCHPEQSGPYLYEHEATSSFSTEGYGCVSCHRPHGSSNERLLTRTGDLLCLQCHGTPPNHRYKHDGIGTWYPCVECHTDKHGSYNSRTFLDADLGTRIGEQPGSCFCHGVDN